MHAASAFTVVVVLPVKHAFIDKDGVYHCLALLNTCRFYAYGKISSCYLRHACFVSNACQLANNASCVAGMLAAAAMNLCWDSRAAALFTGGCAAGTPVSVPHHDRADTN